MNLEISCTLIVGGYSELMADHNHDIKPEEGQELELKLSNLRRVLELAWRLTGETSSSRAI
jgi:hypothetical protein